MVTRPPAHSGYAADILVVCSANLCRSPLAEFLLRARLEEAGGGATVRSAGCWAQEGLPMLPSAARLLHERGIDPGPWSSRSVTAADIENADLILAAERRHLAHLMQLHPPATRRSFLLPGFAQLCSHIGSLRAGTRAQFAQRLDHEAAVALSRIHLEDREIADPTAKGLRAVRRCAGQVDDAARAIAVAFAR